MIRPTKVELEFRKFHLQSIVDDIEKYMELYSSELPNEVQVKGAEPILRKMGLYLSKGHGPDCECPAFAEILVKTGSTPTETMRYGVAGDGSVVTVTIDPARQYMSTPQLVTLVRCQEHNVTVRELLTGLQSLIDGALSLSTATQPPASA